MNSKKLGLAAAALTVGGAVLVGGNLAANADSTTPTPTTSAQASPDAEGANDQAGQGQQNRGPRGQGDECDGAMGGSQDTSVTGDEADKVIAAVQAEDSAVNIEVVRKDPDGAYHALGTKDGQPVFYEVSADLSSVTVNDMAGRGGPHGGPGAQQGERSGQAPDPSGQSSQSSDPAAANGTSTLQG